MFGATVGLSAQNTSEPDISVRFCLIYSTITSVDGITAMTDKALFMLYFFSTSCAMLNKLNMPCRCYDTSPVILASSSCQYVQC